MTTTVKVKKTGQDLFYFNENIPQMGGKTSVNLPIIDDYLELSSDTENGDIIGKSSLIKEIYNNNTLKLFKTESGSYVLDKANLKIGDQTENPIHLINETVVKGKITKDNYSFKYEPLGAVVDDKTVSVFYKDNNSKWFKDKFNEDGIFKKLIHKH